MVIAVFSVIILVFPAVSEDLGRFGEMFEIEERDLMEEIYARLQELSESGRFGGYGRDKHRRREH